MSKKIYILLCLLFYCFGLVYAQTINFQDTKGELTVDGSGSANYKVPIALPPGIKDVAPQIALVYNSSGSNGIAGYGWNITGISSINRVGTRIDLEGYIDPVDFDENDQFTLDGQRLIRLNNSTLGTENHSNLKITSNNANLTTPNYFNVYMADGSQALYGNTPDSKGVSEWLITKFIDKNGNAVNYEYENDDNVHVIKKITWGSNEKQTTNYQNTIEFIYKNRKRFETAFLYGNKLTTKKILDYIIVKTNGQQFKKYILTHRINDLNETNSLNYQIVTQIQEFNKSNQPANPIVFDYPVISKNGDTWFNDYQYSQTSENEKLKEVITSGDFDGDGQIDFVTEDKLYLNPINGSGWSGITIPVSDPENSIYTPVLLLDPSKSIYSTQSIASFTFAKKNVQNNVNLKGLTYSSSSNQIITDVNKQFTSFYQNDLIVNCSVIPDNRHLNKPKEKELPIVLSNDFVGNGFSKAVIITDEREKWEGKITRAFEGFPGQWIEYCSYSNKGVAEKKKIQIFDIQNIDNLSDNSVKSYTVNSDLIDVPFKREFLYSFNDFNGDGIGDLYIAGKTNNNGNFYRIYSIKILSNGDTDVQLLDKKDFIGEYKSIVFGDYNGDGKKDMLIADKEKSNSWKMYMSTGKDHEIVSYNNFEYYLPIAVGKKRVYGFANYQAVDFNGDGKDDFLNFVHNGGESSGSMNHGISFFRPNLGSDSTGKVIFGEQEVSSISLFTSNKKEPFKVIVTNNNGFGTYGGNFIVLKENGIWKGNYSKNQQIEGRLSSVKESNGTIINYINYTELGLERGNNFSYRIEKKLTYPYYVIPKMPRMYIVDEQSVYSSGQTKYKLFRYSDLIANFNGLGILGFGEVSQSSWIIKKGRVDNDPKQAIWSVSKFDYSKRNVETETKSVYAEIRSRGSIFSDFKVLNELNYLTTSYQYNILPDKRYILLPQSKIDKDIVSGVTTATTNTYDSYYNIATTTETKTANGQTFKTTTTNTVENLPSSNPYIIGRLKKEVSKVDAYGGSYTSQKEYTYTNNNISRTKTTVQNSGSQIIDYTYDTFGNVLTITDNGKQLSGATKERIAARKIENIYDTNGRFVVKKKDIEGYEANLQYNLLGQVTKETDKFGVVTSTVYDDWGKLLNVTLTNSSTTPVVTQYKYVRDNDGWSIISFSDQTKDYKAQYFDAVGNNIKNTIKGFSDGQYVSTSTEYDFLGRKLRESQPYFSSPSQYTTYEYDYLLRPIKVTNHTGLVATNTYEGLTATTVEGTRSKKITKDAVGNTVQLVDNGTEVINYTYYPHGGVKTTTYGSHVITTNYDVWGRRTSLLDPSVSSTPYTYSYTVYDEMKEEKMPEGTTTYKYDNFGKITEKNTTGKSNISVKYTYDAAKKGLLIKEYGTNENKSFSNDITYDNFYRITNRNEVTPQFVFGKQFVYDEFSRIMNSESWTMLNNSRVQTVVLNHQYNPYNGELNQLLDISKGVGKVVWKANAKNERGQTLNATLGELISVENTYDIYGNITNIRNKKGNNWLYSVDYEYYFDGQVSRGLLKRRYDSHFGWEEKFTYDSFDRLVSWSSPNGQNYNTYLTDGRIDVNNQVGKYAYNATAKYKKESIQLNAPGSDYYSRRKQQDITYDAFKRPLTISEEGRGNVDFQYGINGGRFYALKQDVLANKTTEKYYSQDGAIEITVDQNGNAKIINYISSPYDTPFFYVTETNLNGSISRSKEGFHYLARDFQGSIMAIYDENANVIERRLFDPWGNIVKVQDKNGAVTEGENAKLIFLDRGYTGHEHFTEVGIIHMNGRIYDPMLKQFLSPDNFIQDSENSQNYNRYGYVWNNPLKYTDPSGELAAETAFLIGAAIGALTYTVGILVSNRSFSFSDFMTSTIMGGISGVASYGVGTLVSNIMPSITNIGTQFAHTVVSASFHAISQGVIAGISGGDFIQSFASALISSAVASSVQGAGSIGSWEDSGLRTILFGTVSGGLTAELTGGNFWQGAATGLAISWLNHTVHKNEGPGDPPKNKVKGIKNKVIFQRKYASYSNFNPDLHAQYASPIAVEARLISGKYLTEGDGNIVLSGTFLENSFSSASVGYTLFEFLTPNIGINSAGAISTGFSIKLFGNTYSVSATPDFINKSYSLSLFRDADGFRNGVQIQSQWNNRSNKLNLRPNPNAPILVPVLSPNPFKIRF